MVPIATVIFWVVLMLHSSLNYDRPFSHALTCWFGCFNILFGVSWWQWSCWLLHCNYTALKHFPCQYTVFAHAIRNNLDLFLSLVAAIIARNTCWVSLFIKFIACTFFFFKIKLFELFVHKQTRFKGHKNWPFQKLPPVKLCSVFIFRQKVFFPPFHLWSL